MKKEELTRFLSDKFFPQDFRCKLCGREVFGADFCADCQKRLPQNDKHTCVICGRKTAADEVCIQCKADFPIYDKAYSAYDYSGDVPAVIARFKRGEGWLAAFFARKMYEKIKDVPADIIIYVPMTERAVRRRGYNQGKLLAEELSLLTGIPVEDNAVAKIEDTTEQKTLSRRERIKNLEDCYVADKKLVKGKTVLVADDVLTTGATLDALSTKLKKAGAVKVYGVTAASVAFKPVKI